VSNSLNDFRKEIRRIESFRVTAEALFSTNHITQKHLEYVYDVSFLSLFIGFENFFENALLNMMCGNHVPAGIQFKVRITFRSPAVAREALYDGRNYTDLLPVKNLVRKASIYLTGGRPFSSITSAERSDLEFFVSTRNLIAHKSKGAEKTFQRQLQTRALLPPSQRTPARYLRSLFAANTTRFEHEMGTMLALATRMWG
jgi:hypothetical protein